MAAIRKMTLLIILLVLPLVFVSLAMAARPSTEARLALGRSAGRGSAVGGRGACRRRSPP